MSARKKAASTASAAATPARTIVYIHGIGNKPPEEVLRCQWDKALLGFGLGERSRMAYWCQRDRHGHPKPESCEGADAILMDMERSGRIGARALLDERPIEDWVEDVCAEDGAKERQVLQSLAKRLTTPSAPRRRVRGTRVHAEHLADEWNPPDSVTRFVTRIFLKDVRDFFFDKSRREAMKASLRSRLETGGGPFVVVAHSQGTMIAYSVLRELDPARFDVALFLTIGSPLGIEEVRDQLAKQTGWKQRDQMPIPRCVRSWTNLYDPKDVVSQGVSLAPFYRGGLALEDHAVVNPDRPRDAHSATGYLSLSVTRQCVRDRIDLERFQRVTPFMVAADVLTDFERQPDAVRRPLLLELAEPAWALQKTRADSSADEASLPGPTDVTLDFMADRVIAEVKKIVPDGTRLEDLHIQKLRRYVSVWLTRSETERLAECPTLTERGLTVRPVYRVWRNAKKRALLEASIHTVQASAAHRSYEAFGQGIEWAVLDSGCSRHPHFDMYRNIARRWDCTCDTDEPVHDGVRAGVKVANSPDGYGHGTHVAGIIAGCYVERRLPDASRTICGVAPQARLHIYKVLDDTGEGDDAWIIKAINHIADVNEKAGGLVIAGVNLSLGGPYEQGIFGCGFTPLCDELRRLWRQGVVVVLAAGNEGHVRLMSADGEIEANMPYSVGDPANLEEAIAVGSIHKQKPHTYGVSHFSSRGPTVDGRSKPDCVAPGEQILSCRHNPRMGAERISDLYYKLDGTSMAAPHVSGLIAAFLSRRREFIGEPDRVKKILLQNCTDLGRDRLLQGAGMPNLVRMLVAT